MRNPNASTNCSSTPWCAAMSTSIFSHRLPRSWEIPDPLTYIFHLRHDVHFHNGQALTSRDVKWTLDSLLSGKADQPEGEHLQQHRVRRRARRLDGRPSSQQALCVAALESFRWRIRRRPLRQQRQLQPATRSAPGPFVLSRRGRIAISSSNATIRTGETSRSSQRVRFIVVPDETTRALELRKGSGDVLINALSGDTVRALAT